jgi:hypothetical protein
VIGRDEMDDHAAIRGPVPVGRPYDGPAVDLPDVDATVAEPWPDSLIGGLPGQGKSALLYLAAARMAVELVATGDDPEAPVPAVVGDADTAGGEVTGDADLGR